VMREPFSEPARRVIVRAQEVAQMFGSSTIGNEHMTFVLAESDDEVGSALANAVDREAMRALLGAASASPDDEMTFTRGAKQSIELAFESAQRLNQGFIGYRALGAGHPRELPIRRRWWKTVDPAALREALELAAKHQTPSVGPPVPRRRPASSWKRIAGDDWPPGDRGRCSTA